MVIGNFQIMVLMFPVCSARRKVPVGRGIRNHHDTINKYCKYHRTQSSCHHHHHRSQHITVLLVLNPKRRWYSSTGNDFRCESTEEPNSNVATHYKQNNNNILQAKMGDSHPTVNLRHLRSEDSKKKM